MQFLLATHRLAYVYPVSPSLFQFTNLNSPADEITKSSDMFFPHCDLEVDYVQGPSPRQSVRC